MSKRIKKIAILGGGTAGWMAATILRSVNPANRLAITLVESSEISPVGVGEATIPHITHFNKIAGIDENVFVRQTQGTFKLGIVFKDWGNIGEQYFHAFGAVGKDFDQIPFYQQWLRLHKEKSVKNIDDYTLNAAAARSEKFMRPIPNGDSPLSEIAYAFHFDSVLYGLYLRDRCVKAGVERIESTVASVNMNPEDDSIDSLVLDDDAVVDADFFIDCSGFRARLIGEACGVGYEDWSHWLPCDSAWAAPTKKNSDLPPYTLSTATPCGWQWKIPLQHRNGNGLVYSSKYSNDDDAKKLFISNLDGELLAEPKKLQFTTGIREKAWYKNCLAVGLSGGFMEPLEATSIHLIQATLIKFINSFPALKINQPLIDQFNNRVRFESEKIRDFLIAHYYVTNRRDSDFWKYVSSMDIPDDLKSKLDIFKSSGRAYREKNELFNDLSWFEVLSGQGMMPDDFDPLAESVPYENALKRAEAVEDVVKSCVDYMPSHQEFIDKNCKAEDVYKNF